ncbi:MAG: glycosyltransferase family protein, partial [Chitinivibrionales bacterium]
IDFVSDRTYVPILNRSGYNASFLPLGVDPGIFLHKGGEWTYTDTVSFVGNSYRNKIDKYVAPHYEYFESILPDIRETASAYRQTRNQDLESEVEKVISRNKPPSDLPFRKAVMITSLFIDYLSRKDTIIMLAEHYPEFRVYGDTGWTQEIDPSRVSGEIGYYDNLSRKYSETMINIDINRIVIKQGFTQRVFDAPASGGFLITSYKPVLEEFFETSGPNKEIVCFRDNNDLIDKVNYYMEAEDERDGIRERAAEKILANHTYNHRIGEIFRRLKQVF